MPRAYTQEQGFSLVEVLVAATILIAGVVSLSQLIILAASNTTAAGLSTRAAILAGQKLEELRTLPPGLAASGEDRVGAYARSWSVEALSGSAARAAVFRVHVEWRGGASGGRATLVTVKSRTAS